GAGGGVVGDRGVVVRRGGPGALPGDEHRATGRADRHRGCVVIAGVVVALHPQLGAGGGVVGGRGIFLCRGAVEAGPGDEDRAPCRANGQRGGEVVAVALSV